MAKQIQINLSSKLYYAVITFVALMILSLGVMAFVGPSGVGHSADELEAPVGCNTGEALYWTGSEIECMAIVDTDTKCDSSGQCAKVCVGTDCRTAWPASPTPPQACQTVSNSYTHPTGLPSTTISVTATCPTGYEMTSGWCETGVWGTQSGNGWYCSKSITNSVGGIIYAYTRCC